tara:strand:- start:29 stop:721 length:693 start_codon:yes stop_codon:yes gene_type:complete
MDLEKLTLYVGDFHASRGPLPGSSEAQKMTAISGRSWLPLLKTYGLGGSLAKMCVALLTSQWASNAAFLTWKASGIKPSHLLFQLAPSMPRTDETASGLSRTPDANMGNRGAKSREMYEKSLQTGVHAIVLNDQVAMWPTPRAAEWKGTGPLGSKSHKHRLGKGYLDATVQEAEQVTGQLNPQWVEWLQGYEIGHTDLGHWEMPSSRKSSKKSEEQSSLHKTKQETAHDE